MTLPAVAILAGGLGTRLGQLTREKPKPMIDIGGRPFLERVIESFSRCGFRRFVLLVGYGANMVSAHFGDGSNFNVEILYSNEKELVGTGGAVRDARNLLGPQFLLTYGDVLRGHDYSEFVANHRESSCLGVFEYVDGLSTIDSGNVSLTEDRLRVETYRKGGRLPWVDAGFALVGADAIDLMPSEGRCSFEQVVYPALAARGQLEAEIVNRNFHDIGNLNDLESTRRALGED